MLRIRSGFTLLELLLVITIVAALAGLIINALNPAERLLNASEAKDDSSAEDLNKAIQDFVISNGGVYPTSLQQQISLGETRIRICKTGQVCNGVDITEILTGGYISNLPAHSQLSSSTYTGYDIIYNPTSGITVDEGLNFYGRDNFQTSQAAPYVNGRSSEPGPGITNISPAADPNASLVSITNQKLVIAAKSSGNNIHVAFNNSVSNSLGTGFFSKVQYKGGTVYLLASQNGSAAPLTFGNIISTGVFSSTVNYSNYINNGAVSINSWVESGVILRENGAFMVSKVDDTEWILNWVDDSFFQGNYYNLVNPAGNGVEIDTMRTVDVPSPWNERYGIASDYILGDVPSSQSFTHESNFLGYTVIDTLPASGQIEIRFRMQDSSNYWQATVDSSGTLDLDQVTAGVVTPRGTSAGIVTAGERIGVLAYGNIISLFDSSNRRVNYNSASSFSTETDGMVASLGTGGNISDISTFPRNITGEAAVQLERVMK